MTKSKWNSFPYLDDAYAYEGAALEENWPRLHAGDREPFPQSAEAQDAWRAYHRGDFEAAARRGEALGAPGAAAAAKAINIYASYLVEDRRDKLDLFLRAAALAENLQNVAPENPNGWYLHAQALGRYSQCVSVAKALAEGLGGKIKHSLETALKLDKRHADAHIALGAYHAEIVDKIGGMIASLTYGASKEAALRHFEEALKLNPGSAIARMEYANALAMLFGAAKLKQATALYEEAARCVPADAMERLDVEAAKAELAD
jgi:tetratricopeptide (TPR) repeat protein